MDLKGLLTLAFSFCILFCSLRDIPFAFPFLGDVLKETFDGLAPTYRCEFLSCLSQEDVPSI
ncbi:hypothetical protein THIOKS13320031 [Thiocapsa sp. KS1]|nr:hypothetical protein THIOKS13320031 [Thiocapsa sp. KS1]